MGVGFVPAGPSLPGWPALQHADLNQEAGEIVHTALVNDEAIGHREEAGALNAESAVGAGQTHEIPDLGRGGGEWLCDSGAVDQKIFSLEVPLGEGHEQRLVGVENRLSPGRYTLACAVLHQEKGENMAASTVQTLEFEVKGAAHPGAGLVSLDHAVTIKQDRSIRRGTRQGANGQRSRNGDNCF